MFVVIVLRVYILLVHDQRKVSVFIVYFVDCMDGLAVDICGLVSLLIGTDKRRPLL